MQAKTTPLMQQYWEVKAQHEDKIILFRMGDFFEMFHQDAEVAAPILGIALTQRNKKDSESARMCGVPYHSIATPIAKLLMAGHKVAICDQIEDPALAKGLVKRAVTRVLTPGMVYDPDTLDQLSANYLCSYDAHKIAFADITTGEAFVYPISTVKEREELILLLAPVELVLSESEAHKRKSEGLNNSGLVSSFALDGIDDCQIRLRSYIEKMQGPEVLKSLMAFALRDRQQCMRLTPTVLRHLEIFTNGRGEKQGCLFTAINRTVTSSGARLLKGWLSAPLLDVKAIERRQNEIKLWMEQPMGLKTFRQIMSQLGDVERRLGKVHSTTFNARDLVAIAQSVTVGEALHQMHPQKPALSTEMIQLAQEINLTFNQELPIAVKEGGLIRPGRVAELDALMELTQDAQKLLLELETRERQNTGIASLKVRYNSVFGFYIELTKTHAHKAPDHYLRKQTLTNAERYTTDELSRLEEKILSARSRRDQMEYDIFLKLRAKVIEQALDWLQAARLWSEWDVLSALGWLALEQKYCCPRFSNGGRIQIGLSRHPVVEQGLKGVFVPNAMELKEGDCLLLTGPNMAGKSTFMRQVALLAIMAQIGSMVPAESAELPLFQQIFTRIGANDFVSEGLSTFMVEMSETSDILQAVNSRSLVIMDEIGRGTSTYDGLSLAQAILEHLVSDKKPYLLFATHYHELTGLDRLYPQIHNAHMMVQDKGGEVQFLHTLRQGPANRSYGIHVAKLAGLPVTVTERAQHLLGQFEGQRSGGVQLSFVDFQSAAQPQWLDEIKSLNLSGMTPLDALNKLFQWQREASS